MRIMKKALCILAIAATVAMPLQAHSGRLDSKGGHRDNKNVSGLGSYHYHDGLDGKGYPAHLHTNGICSYANVHTWEVGKTTSSSSSVSSSSTTTTTKVTKPTYTFKDYAFKYGETTFKVQGTVKDNATLVGLRDLCTNLGITINSVEGNVIKLSRDNKTLSIGIGNKKAYSNITTIDLATPAISYNNTTYVPLKDVVTALGYTLTWADGTFYIQ